MCIKMIPGLGSCEDSKTGGSYGARREQCGRCDDLTWRFEFLLEGPARDSALFAHSMGRARRAATSQGSMRMHPVL